jgi:HK97 family phage major capsid protein
MKDYAGRANDLHRSLRGEDDVHTYDNTNELHIARSRAIETMKALVDKAESESRELSRSERARFEEIDGEIRDLDRRIARVAARNGDADTFEARASQARFGARTTRDLGEWLASETRDLFGSTGGGQYVVPTEYLSTVFEFLAAESVGLKSGFNVLEAHRAELQLPKVTSDAASAWVAEGEEIVSDDPGLEPITATPRKIAAMTALSNEIIADSNPAVLGIVMRSLLRSLARKLDAGFFEGSGTAPEIAGLREQAGLSVSMGTDGGTLDDLDPIAEAMALLSEANTEATAVVMAARTWGDLLKLREDSTSLKPLLGESAGSPTEGIRRSLFGVPVYLTSISVDETQGTSADASSVYVYNAGEVYAVRRQEARVDLDRSRLFNFDKSELRAISRWDMVVPNPEAVCRIVGVRPAA